MTINTHGLRADFGKHRGELYTRIPIPYLRWMVNEGHQESNIARAELERRGIQLVDRLVDISKHAIDSASLRCWRLWKKTRNDNTEGLHAWLARMAAEALDKHEPDSNGRIDYRGLRLIIGTGELYPTLKTIMPARNSDRKTPRKMRHFDTVDEEKRDERASENTAPD